MPPQEELDVLTIAEAARELGLAERTVVDRIHRGAMRGIRVGQRVWVVPRDEVEQWRSRGKLKAGRPRRQDG